jgi:hypothetical protein
LFIWDTHDSKEKNFRGHRVGSELEFIGQMRPQRLKSWDEEFREEREQFFKYEKDRELRRSGKLVKIEPETTYERDE